MPVQPVQRDAHADAVEAPAVHIDEKGREPQERDGQPERDARTTRSQHEEPGPEHGRRQRAREPCEQHGGEDHEDDHAQPPSEHPRPVLHRHEERHEHELCQQPDARKPGRTQRDASSPSPWRSPIVRS